MGKTIYEIGKKYGHLTLIDRVREGKRTLLFKKGNTQKKTY